MKRRSVNTEQTNTERFNLLLDKMSEFLSQRKGLLPMIGVVLISLNFVLQFFSLGWFGESNLLLHLGVILAILGFLIAWAL